MGYGLAPFRKSLSHRDTLCDACLSVNAGWSLSCQGGCHLPTQHHCPSHHSFSDFFPSKTWLFRVFFCPDKKAPNSYPQSSDWFRVPLQQAKPLNTRDPGDVEHGEEVSLSPAVEQATPTSLALSITVLFVTKGEGAAFGDLKPDAVLTPAVTFSAVKEESHVARGSSSLMGWS